MRGGVISTSITLLTNLHERTRGLVAKNAKENKRTNPGWYQSLENARTKAGSRFDKQNTHTKEDGVDGGRWERAMQNNAPLVRGLSREHTKQ